MFIGINLSSKKESLYGTLHVLVVGNAVSTSIVIDYLKCIIGCWLLILKCLLLLSLLYNAIVKSVCNVVVPFNFLSQIKLIPILMTRRRHKSPRWRHYLIGINRWSFWRSDNSFDLLLVDYLVCGRCDPVALLDVIWSWLVFIMNSIAIWLNIVMSIILLYVLSISFNSILFCKIHFSTFNIIIYDQLSDWRRILNRYMEPLIWLRSCLLKELIC